jgi:hypothetical protein
MAATMGSKAAANAIAYTVASLAMPSIPEIAAVDTARVAAASTGGVLNGSSEAAEAAKTALDLRAALTMETYEAATSATVMTPGEFMVPPAIANGAGTADPAQSADTAFQGDPVQGSIAVAAGFVNNPAVASAATQVANVVGSVATSGVSTVGSLGANAISAAASPAMGGMSAPMAMRGGVGGVAGAAAAATRSAAAPGASVNLNGTLKLPEGWGAGASIGGTPAGAPVSEPVNVARFDAAPVRPASSGSPLMGHQAHGSEDDESEHTTADYLRSTEHFNDGRYAADGVIGADAAGPAK